MTAVNTTGNNLQAVIRLSIHTGGVLSPMILLKPNVTQLNSTQSNCKRNFVGLDIVVTWNAYKPWNLHPQTFHALLDQLES